MNKEDLENWIEEKKSIYDIVKLSGKAFSTIRYWLKKFSLRTCYKNFKEGQGINKESSFFYSRTKSDYDFSFLDYTLWTQEQKESYSYILGFYLGDGCLGHVKNSFTLMIVNQSDRHETNQRIAENIKIIFPTKNVMVRKRKEANCAVISMTSLRLDEMFPHGKGSKHTRKIVLRDWQKEIVKLFPENFIKGMMESDGCRYVPRKKECPTYVIYQFANCSLDLHGFLQEAAAQIGLEFTFRARKSNGEKDRTQMFLTSFNKKTSVELLDSFVGIKK